ncbi:MAG: hypothetical protein ACREAU_01655 [Nitrosopumilaceae archaeon]
MKKWKVTTSTYVNEVDHKPGMTAMTAAVTAFENKAPKELGVLTMCMQFDKIQYVNTETVLKKAGYKVNKTDK